MSGQQHAPAALYPRERPGTHFTGGRSGRTENFVPTGIRAPDRPSCSSVAIPTELPGPHTHTYIYIYTHIYIVLYCCYLFRQYLRHPQAALYQDLKLAKHFILQKLFALYHSFLQLMQTTWVSQTAIKIVLVKLQCIETIKHQYIFLSFQS